LNAEKSIGGHVKKFITLLFFSAESHFTWQLDVEGFSKKAGKFHIKNGQKKLRGPLFSAAPCILTQQALACWSIRQQPLTKTAAALLYCNARQLSLQQSCHLKQDWTMSGSINQ